MKLTFLAVFAAATLSAAPAMASFIDVRYSGTVSVADGTTANSGYIEGDTISGEFVLDSTTLTLRGSSLGRYVAPPGDIVAAVTPTLFDAIYKRGTFVFLPGDLNHSITVDLSALTTFGSNDPVAVLLDPQFASHLDLSGGMFASTAVYLLSDAAATNPVAVFAFIKSISVSVFEPTSLLLLGTALGGLTAVRRRRA